MGPYTSIQQRIMHSGPYSLKKDIMAYVPCL